MGSVMSASIVIECRRQQHLNRNVDELMSVLAVKEVLMARELLITTVQLMRSS